MTQEDLKRAVGRIEMTEEMKARVTENARARKRRPALNLREIGALAACFALLIAAGGFYLSRSAKPSVPPIIPEESVTVLPPMYETLHCVYAETGIPNNFCVWGTEENVRKCIEEQTYVEWNGMKISPELYQVLNGDTKATYLALMFQSISDPNREYDYFGYIMLGYGIPESVSDDVFFTSFEKFRFFIQNYPEYQQYMDDTVLVLAPISLRK